MTWVFFIKFVKNLASNTNKLISWQKNCFYFGLNDDVSFYSQRFWDGLQRVTIYKYQLLFALYIKSQFSIESEKYTAQMFNNGPKSDSSKNLEINQIFLQMKPNFWNLTAAHSKPSLGLFDPSSKVWISVKHWYKLQIEIADEVSSICVELGWCTGFVCSLFWRWRCGN